MEPNLGMKISSIRSTLKLPRLYGSVRDHEKIIKIGIPGAQQNTVWEKVERVTGEAGLTADQRPCDLPSSPAIRQNHLPTPDFALYDLKRALSGHGLGAKAHVQLIAERCSWCAHLKQLGR